MSEASDVVVVSKAPAKASVKKAKLVGSVAKRASPLRKLIYVVEKQQQAVAAAAKCLTDAEEFAWHVPTDTVVYGLMPLTPRTACFSNSDGGDYSHNQPFLGVLATIVIRGEEDEGRPLRCRVHAFMIQAYGDSDRVNHFEQRLPVEPYGPPLFSIPTPSPGAKKWVELDVKRAHFMRTLLLDGCVVLDDAPAPFDAAWSKGDTWRVILADDVRRWRGDECVKIVLGWGE